MTMTNRGNRPMKGILLAGGKGTRLYPLTLQTSKQLLPVYNKPMLYYPLTTLMLAGVTEVLIVTTPHDQPQFKTLLGDGSQWGISIAYEIQEAPKGIAQAIEIGAEFVGTDPVVLMLGDNVLYGRLDFLRNAIDAQASNAVVFGCHVSDPSAFGVVEFDKAYNALTIEEKPSKPKSNWAVPGIYIYPNDVVQKVRDLKPSDRGELEITDLNRMYMNEGRLKAFPMGRGIAWFDTGTPGHLLRAAAFVESIESQQGLVIGAPEEAAYRMGYIAKEEIAKTIANLPNCHYRTYLEHVLDEDI